MTPTKWFIAGIVTGLLISTFITSHNLVKSSGARRDDSDETFSFSDLPEIPKEIASPPASTTTISSTHLPASSSQSNERGRFHKYIHEYKYLPSSPIVERTKSKEICGDAPHYTEYFAQKPQKTRSRYQEDKIIYETFFKNATSLLTNLTTPTQLSYIELGAYDGISASNTRFFDLCLQWNGLLLEANPSTYPQVIKNRPHAHKMSFAPSCLYDTKVSFHDYPLANAGMEGHAKTYTDRRVVDVPCAPLQPVIDDLIPSSRVLFFSLDVEGSEPLVLQTIDFERTFVDVFMIEVENEHCRKRRTCEIREEVRRIMRGVGYVRYTGLVSASDVYVHPESPFRIPVGHPASQYQRDS